MLKYKININEIDEFITCEIDENDFVIKEIDSCDWEKTKYDDLDIEKVHHREQKFTIAHQALWGLFKNGIVRMDADNKNEVQKLIKVLTDLNLEFCVKYIPDYNNYRLGFNEVDYYKYEKNEFEFCLNIIR